MKNLDNELKNSLFTYEIKGEIYAETMEQATDIIMKIENENKECFCLRHISIQG